MLALALESLPEARKAELLGLIRRANPGAEVVERVRRLYDQAQVFDRARKLLEKFKAKAEALADETDPQPLRELLYYLVDSVLQVAAPPEQAPALGSLLTLPVLTMLPVGIA